MNKYVKSKLVPVSWCAFLELKIKFYEIGPSNGECSLSYKMKVSVIFREKEIYNFLTVPRIQYGEGNGTQLQYSCLENPMGGGVWWATVHGVAQSRTRLKQLSSNSSLYTFLVETRASQIWHYWYFGPNNSLLRETVLLICTMFHNTHGFSMPITPLPLPELWKQKCLQASANASWFKLKGWQW